MALTSNLLHDNHSSCYSIIGGTDQFRKPYTYRQGFHHIMSITLADSTAKKLGLTSTTHIKLNAHLCLCCDSFFQRVQKIFFSSIYEKLVRDGSITSVDEKFRSSNGYDAHAHWAGLSQLSKAVDEGCHICRLFLSQLTKSERDRLANLDQKQPLQFLLSLSFGTKALQRSPRYLLKLECTNMAGSLFHDLVILSTQGRLFCRIILHRLTLIDEVCFTEKWISRDRRSSAFQTASHWLNDCVHNHARCTSPLLKSSSWPSRLIAVGNNDSEVRLCEFVHKPNYLTLSHCWGREEMPLKLTLSNKTSLCHHIPADKLSPTFRDAVAFTRILKTVGVDFLWIDALCIVQDSAEDWERESAIMGDIYGNGLCNLAASTGSDGTTGLFPANDTWFSHTCVVKAGPASCLDGSFSIRNTEILCDSATAHVRDKLITSRAWCVQERILSKRILHFAKHQVVWDCRTFLAREQDPTCLLDNKGYKFSDDKRNINYNITEHETCRKGGVDPNIFELYRQWMNVVRTFTRCNLTRHTDKLKAISGLARKFHESLGPNEEYVGGLWKHYLYLHLLWDGSAGRTNFRWKEYRAPSWSWASFEGSVYNHRTNSEAITTCTSLVRASTEQKHVKADPYGALSSAILFIEGPLLKLRLGLSGSKQYLVPTFSTESGTHFSLSQGFLVNLDFNVSGIDIMDAHCLVVIQETFPHKTQLAGLILVRQETVKGQYIRIGHGFTLPIELLREARSRRLADKNDYESILENGDYRISII